MKRLLVAVILARRWWVRGHSRHLGAGEGVRPISPAQLQKILKFVDTIGGKEEFPPPTAQNLGISGDPNQKLPVTVVVTDDNKVYFVAASSIRRTTSFGCALRTRIRPICF